MYTGRAGEIGRVDRVGRVGESTRVGSAKLAELAHLAKVHGWACEVGRVGKVREMLERTPNPGT